MKYLIHEVGDPFKNFGRSRLWGDNLQQSLMDRISPSSRSKLTALRTVDEEHLRRIGAFDFPDPALSGELIEAFFNQGYPFFPIFHRTEFFSAYGRNRISPLVLNALFCVSAIHCSEDLIRRLDYDSRYLACSTFYHRAKALHDNDYETDGVAIIQACILLMNWWQGPMEQKDTWYWLGVGSNLAQSLGMHRAKSYRILGDERQKLWRRIWWVLFINDIHHAAVFGRPPHIHSQYTDVNPLTPSDMTASDFTHANAEESNIFLVEYCRLATLVDRCLLEKYSAASSPQMKDKAWLALTTFSSTLLNNGIDSASSLTTERGFYPAVLSLIHLDYSVVVGRMFSSDIHVPATSGVQSYFKSAGSICRILEDLLSSPSALVARLPYVAFPAIFCSILIHIIYLRKEPGSIRLVAENRARLAMVVLDQLQDRWPLVVWTRYLLDTLLKNTEPPAVSSPQYATLNQYRRSSERANRPWTEDDIPGPASLSPDPQHVVSSSRSTDPTPDLHNAHSSPRDHLGFNTGMHGAFSPIPFMLPWNSLLEDATDFDQWLL
ncbi:uncharacterized protein A1O9_00009 [Exophiala aquamarina CBS 119918]|uniref:Xylanolytic transcriptional activator regulatory domain-containing protein n=1 Tax=Exophiala aquamarina CBS 119918 TaxID=1182545 RepID=A0A072PQK3_9EURO|nr:uncharacterized protein A1O9_00009 [Exophiala aquamarina CBS 119918]KEF62037.1 hypothetical protein A1O9_00009 [Exophiala aquamarina CBS 119918]